MDSDVTKDLKDISFRALPGQLTAVLSIDQAERRYIVVNVTIYYYFSLTLHFILKYIHSIAL